MSSQAALRQNTPDFEFDQRALKPRRRRRKRAILLVLLLFLLSLVASAGVLLLSPTVLEAMSSMVLKPQPGMVAWNGTDRITVVAMGLTQRTTEPARTDTLLAMDIDPAHHRINMLSVPRDLWVNIPGYGQGKLAIAYELGGPKLAAYTLEQSLGIPVDYSIAMTFRGFTQLIDAMGGVNVTVPQELKDPTYPCLTGYAYCPIDIKPGAQHMNGALALEFVRERHAFAQQDLARVQDQQAFSEAVKRTLLSPATWIRFPRLLSSLQQTLMTNMPLNDLPAVGVRYLLTPKGQINHQYISVANGMVQSGWSADGQSILNPTNASVIPNLVHQLFGDPTLTQQNASIAVLNGTAAPGIASQVESTVQGLGFHPTATSNADRTDYRQCQVIINTSVPGDVSYTARRLQRLLNATLIREPLPGQPAQIVAIIGSDFPTG